MRRRLSYANVMSTVVVFVALGGTTYAAVALPRDSVGAKQVRNGSLGTGELSPKAIAALRAGDLPVQVITTPQNPPSCPAGGCGPAPAGTVNDRTAVCPPGTKVISGGFAGPGEHLRSSGPLPGLAGWSVSFVLETPDTFPAGAAYALCV